ncbi:hypothetical protein AYJ54_05040 [Bradyrhizobium centrolobii]|uniref:Uncharacterized protein n=1 Tax=Bradyrhizobium centrolobii TaxID=1505087 RepID=A0A176ZC57_9BRAD|nr:hypothetical protein [Bradyrhizobium centrolobii]OAF17515.1 hypothetical protein AYJ54_05040 [Bradyrhizobium centrolobii]
MKDFSNFLTRLGNLHDCTITLFEWRPEQNSISFEIEDLYFNFEGLPEYPGAQSGRLVLEEVQLVSIDVRDLERPLRIDDFTVEANTPSAAAVSVTLQPRGRISIRCQRATFPDVGLP